MNKKTKLSDEVMDLLSGGVFTYGGQGVVNIVANPEGARLELSDGTTTEVTWNDETQARFGKDFMTTIEMLGELGRKKGDTASFQLEDYLK